MSAPISTEAACIDNTPVYRQLEDYAGAVVEQAAKVADLAATKLTPVMHNQPGRGDFAPDPQTEWPPHFSEMRKSLSIIENYLGDISYHISATGL